MYSKTAMCSKSVIASAIAIAMATPSVLAQTGTTDDEDTAIDEIVTIGQRAMITNAILRQQESDVIKNIVTSDAIGNLTDQNVAEAVRRLAGVNVLNDQGEGRFISVRGLDPSVTKCSKCEWHTFASTGI